MLIPKLAEAPRFEYLFRIHGTVVPRGEEALHLANDGLEWGSGQRPTLVLESHGGGGGGGSGGGGGGMGAAAGALETAGGDDWMSLFDEEAADLLSRTNALFGLPTEYTSTRWDPLLLRCPRACLSHTRTRTQCLGAG